MQAITIDVVPIGGERHLSRRKSEIGGKNKDYQVIMLRVWCCPQTCFTGFLVLLFLLSL